MKLGAYILVHNEDEFLRSCIDYILPFVDELLLANHGSTDDSKVIIECYKDIPKVKIIDIDYSEPVAMGLVRTKCVEMMETEWILAVDADEFYPSNTMIAIRKFVENPGDAISARLKYHQLAWRKGYKQSNFIHYVDRLYKKECIDKVEGILPNDMLYIKKEYLDFPQKSKGIVGILEYDSIDDTSIEHRKQPILDIYYYHLARARGYNYEFTKWTKYHKNIGGVSEEKAMETARTTHWVNGLYDMEKIDVPFEYGIKNPKVSVIIPNYNYNSYVGMAIESVLAQTYPAHEIIVVDDGSWDDSIMTISKYPVTLIKQSNQGVANARNNGARVATGDYLIFLDADDEIEPRFVERCIGEMKGDVQVCYSNLDFIGEQSGILDMPDINKMKECQPIPSTCALIDYRAWELVGGFKNDEIFEDWGFWNRVYDKGYVFKHIKEPLFKYRVHGVSRITLLDSKMTEGYAQLRDRYGIIKEVDREREEYCKKLIGLNH